MPGIAGLVTKMPREQAEAQLQNMVASLCHESFYETGTWVDEALGVYVGWTTLPHSFSADMPLLNERGDVALVFSGEEYPSELKQKEHKIGVKAAFYLVQLYEEDPSFPSGLNGMFHGVVVDRRQGSVMLFNDRYGMHRICYHEANEGFYFAGEIKAILAVRPELRIINLQSLGEVVACGCVLENRTIFQGIQVLPGASAWIFQDGRISRKSSYFEPRDWEEQAPLDSESYYAVLRDTISRNLPRYFRGSEGLGIALTGGLDTRVIMAWQRAGPQELPCYTFGGIYRDSEDVRIARRIAQMCGQSHKVITVGSEFLAKFPYYAERSIHLTEGGADVYRASDLYVSEKARQIAPAKIVGTYGSEIVRHAVMFKPVELPTGLFRADFLAYVHKAKNTYARLREQHPTTFAVFRQSPWYHQGILAIEQSQLTVRSPFMDNGFVRTAFRAPNAAESGQDFRLRLVADGNPLLAFVRTDLGVSGKSGPSLSALSRRVLEFTLKAEYAYDYGMPQWIAQVDHIFLRLHLERLFLGRHKLLHFRVWYRDVLSEYVRQMLLDTRTLSRPYIQRKTVEAIVNEHLKEGRNYTVAIHKLLTLEILHRQFIDSK